MFEKQIAQGVAKGVSSGLEKVLPAAFEKVLSDYEDNLINMIKHGRMPPKLNVAFQEYLTKNNMEIRKKD